MSEDESAGAMLLDVRRAGVFAQAAHLIPGARWCDPADVEQWAAELPAGHAVLVYCVYGHEVGRSGSRQCYVMCRLLQWSTNQFGPSARHSSTA